MGDLLTGLDRAAVRAAGAFLARLVRLDRSSPVRLRPAGPATVELWARLPFDALVTRNVRGCVPGDVTVRADELLDVLALAGEPAAPVSVVLPARRDGDWRWPLPPAASRTVERLPAAELHRLGAAAARTLREASTAGVRGRAVGERVLRDALLDHVPIVVVADDGTRVEISQRLVQAVTRMGFLGTDPVTGTAEVRVAGGWVGLAADFGTAWHRAAPGLAVRVARPPARPD